MNITWPDGTTTASVAPLHDVMALQRSAVYQAIVEDYKTVRCSPSVLLLVTNKEKRRGWVFILNVLALVFTIGCGVISFAVLSSISTAGSVVLRWNRRRQSRVGRR